MKLLDLMEAVALAHAEWLESESAAHQAEMAASEATQRKEQNWRALQAAHAELLRAVHMEQTPDGELAQLRRMVSVPA